MMQCFLAKGRDGLTHVVEVDMWSCKYDEHERDYGDDVDRTLCDERNYFVETWDVPITCVECAAAVVAAEREMGIQWKERS